MVQKIEWFDAAIADLIEIRDYLLRPSPGNAETIIRQIERTAEGFVTFPNGHRVIPEFSEPDRRETSGHRWRLMYRVLPDRFRIVGVIHGSRLLENSEGRPFDEAPQQEYLAS